MMTTIRLSLVVSLLSCMTFVFALQHSSDRRIGFAPDVQAFHERNTNQFAPYLAYDPNPNLDDSHAVALDLAEQALGFRASYIVKNSYVSAHNNVRHVYLRQTADDGKEIFNADLNINIHKRRALNIGHSFFNGSTTEVVGHLPSIAALKSLIAYLQINAVGSAFSISSPVGINQHHTIDGIRGAVQPASVSAGYIRLNGLLLEPVWSIELDMGTNWWSACVSSRSGEVLSLVDWVNDINTFDTYPIGVNDPSDGMRQVLPNPAVINASPLGWNNQNSSVFLTTIGNNVYTQSNPTGSSINWINFPRPSGAPHNDYSFPINFTVQPVDYVNASTSNLFVWNNYIHDIFYQYGFDEVSGNFQENNFGRGGLGGDAVQANSQDGTGYNNANFATPPDGQRPRMRMYVWTLSNPWRDGDLDQGIIIHEYAHGISNRLTGGPANSNCLGAGEAGGMGEGWGDFFATVLRQRQSYKPTDTFAMGDYSANQTGGIRRYPYTTDMTINPETYAFINGANYTGVHAKGEVWCGILWEVYWNMVEQYGFAADLYMGEGGNNKILQLVVDGMKIQPCRPNFVDARDAIFKADAVNYNGANYCLLWRGFAKRGLGINAVGGTSSSSKVREDFNYPVECANKPPIN